MMILLSVIRETRKKTDPQRLKPVNSPSTYGTAKQAAEKYNKKKKKLPSGAEAR